MLASRSLLPLQPKPTPLGVAKCVKLSSHRPLPPPSGSASSPPSSPQSSIPQFKDYITTMARPTTTNAMFFGQVEKLIELSENDHRDECIEQSRALLGCPALPWYQRMKLLMLLASLAEGWDEAEKYRSDMESLWWSTRCKSPVGQDAEVDESLRVVRVVLDGISDESDEAIAEMVREAGGPEMKVHEEADTAKEEPAEMEEDVEQDVLTFGADGFITTTEKPEQLDTRKRHDEKA